MYDLSIKPAAKEVDEIDELFVCPKPERESKVDIPVSSIDMLPKVLDDVASKNTYQGEAIQSPNSKAIADNSKQHAEVQEASDVNDTADFVADPKKQISSTEITGTSECEQPAPKED